MPSWFGISILAAVLYGLHQVFTKLAAPRIGDGIGGLVVEASATFAIAMYLIYLRASGRWDQPFSSAGFGYAALTGLCVGIGTVAFFLMFQRGAPISIVPGVLALGMAIMVLAGPIIFAEPLSSKQIAGLMMAAGALWLLRG